MQLGDVYYWESDQAIGYETRSKYHVYVGEGNWIYQGHIFLFINKSNAHGGSYRITKPPYDFLKYPESYISCNGVVPYDDGVVSSKIGDLKGRLLAPHILELKDHILRSDEMDGHAIRLVCAGIDAGLK